MKNQIKNTAPLTIGEYPNQQALSRRFLGNLFPDNTFEKNELKAYLKGQSVFHYRKDEMGNPIPYRVRQEYFYVTK